MGEGLRQAIAKLSRATIIDAKTVKEFTKELQKSLLSADVEVSLVFQISKEIEAESLKSRPPSGITSKDYITDIVYKKLVGLMGSTYTPEMKSKRVLLMGLYGSGKTTTAVKIAKYYQDRGMSAAVICCDVTRPAAYEQLETLAAQANITFFGIKGEKDPVKVLKASRQPLKGKNVVICDTSGRNALDDNLIAELKAVAREFGADEKILVVGADTGQTPGSQAREFDSAVKISGGVGTGMDGSVKGGGAISAANAAKAHVMFIGTGEKIGNIEPFDSEKFIGSLLGIPDMSSLLDKVSKAVAEAKIKPEDMQTEELNFETFYTQLKAMGHMGPLKNVFGMMGASDVPKEMLDQGEDRLNKFKVIISSMTQSERKDERLLHNPDRIKRIAVGSGTSEHDVHMLISQFNKMKKMFNTFKNDRGFRKRFAKFGA